MSFSYCPDAARLRRLVAGEMSPQEQAALANHIDGCRNCQAALDRLTAAEDSWSGIAEQIGGGAAPVDSALANVMGKLSANPQETMAEPRRDVESKLDFLDPPDQPGQLGKLAHYEVLDVVGKGGMGIVLRAHDTKLQRIAAIKVMMPELAAIASARQRFIREARAAAAVSHDHIVTIHAVEEDHTPPYLVMQYVAGRSLQQRIDDAGALEVKEILRIGMQTASGLAAAHAQGLVHRDIKPANILLENGVERVKITDFGLARVGDDSRVTQTGVVTGTPQYMSPEQAGGKEVDHRADLFSLGGVMYAMCTGYAPFRASSSMAVLKKVCDETPRPIRDLNPEIPDWLVAIVDKLMAKEPMDRFQSAAEVASLLGQHLAHLQQPAVHPRPASLAQAAPVRATTAPGKRSLALPLFLIAAPFLLMLALLLSSRLIAGPNLGVLETLLILTVIGGPFLVAGLILLVHRFTTPSIESPPASLRPAGAARLDSPRPVLHSPMRSLTLPIALMVLPIVLVPLAILFIYFVGQGGMGSVIVLPALIGAAVFFLGLILLIVQLGKRPQLVDSQASGPATAPKRSNTWAPVLIIAVLLLCICPLPIVGFGVLGSFFLWSRNSGGQNPQGSLSDSYGSAGPVTNDIPRPMPRDEMPGGLAPWMRGVDPKLKEGLDWFPRESTFCAAFSIEAAPAEISQAVSGALKSMPVGNSNPIADIMDAVGAGRVTRLGYACVEDPAGKRSRHFLRLSGSWNRDKVVAALMRRPRSRSVEENLGAGTKVTFITSDADYAFAVVGGSDVLVGGYERVPEGAKKGHEEVVREALNCYFRSSPRLSEGTLGAGLADVPANAFFMVSGELPKGLQEPFKSAFSVLPQKATIGFVEGKGDGAADTIRPNRNKDWVAVSFHMVMNNRADAENLLKDSVMWPKRFQGALDRSLKEAESRQAARPVAERVPDLANIAADLKREVPIQVTASASGFSVEGTVRVPAKTVRGVIALVRSSPLSGASAMSVRILKKFDPKSDKPFQTQIEDRHVTVEGDSWLIDAKKPPPSGRVPPDIVLFEMPKQDVAGGTLVLRFKMRTEKITLNANVGLKAGSETLWLDRGFSPTVSGTTNWKDYEIRYQSKDAKPADVQILAAIGGSGKVWIKDVELSLRQPLPDAAIPAPRPAEPKMPETLLHRFDPGVDQPITRELSGRKVSFEDGAIRVQRSMTKQDFPLVDAPRTLLFEIRKPDIGNRRVTVRAKMKTEGKAPRSAASLAFDFGETHFLTGPLGPGRYGTTNWTPYEFSYDFKEFVSPRVLRRQHLDQGLGSSDNSAACGEIEMKKPDFW